MSSKIYKDSFLRLKLSYAFYATEWGILKIGYDGNYIFSIDLVKKIDSYHQPSSLTQLAYQQLQEYFQGVRRSFTIPYQIEGTKFQKRVYRALSKIAYGQLCSYQFIAQQIGNSKACRAVGGALHRNPLIIVIPCHRVIGCNGQLTGYALGLAMKQRLIDLEQRYK